VLKSQLDIANMYLGGKWFRLWGTIPLYPSMEKTADMYEKVIKNAPYSDVAPQAQMNMGAAYEKRKDFPAAVKAYERASDRYNDRKAVPQMRCSRPRWRITGRRGRRVRSGSGGESDQYVRRFYGSLS